MSERSVYYNLKIENIRKDLSLSFDYKKAFSFLTSIKKSDGEVTIDISSIDTVNTGIFLICSLPITLTVNSQAFKIKDVFFASFNSDTISTIKIQADSSLTDTDESDVELYLYSL